MSAQEVNPFDTRAQLGEHSIYRLDKLAGAGLAPQLERLPFSIKILLESVLRNCDGYLVTAEDVKRLAAWTPAASAAGGGGELPFLPARVLMQDFSGVPCVVDLAAMRSAYKRLGGDPKKINPLVPVDVVIDHSMQVDYAGDTAAFQRNAEMEFARNRERYAFLRWGAQAFNNLRVVPPDTGIIHQINLEYLAQGVLTRPTAAGPVLFPDTVVGTDSHTTMVNGLGVLGWGVGGIEADAVMLGQPLYMVIPQVIGCKLSGELREGVTATDLALTIVQMLRKKGVVDKFVEFYGPGLAAMSLPDRAVVANMAPEYGATMGFFPTDAETLHYLRLTGRAASADLLERYAKEQGLFRTEQTPDPLFTDTAELNLADVEPSLAGPKRPQDRVPLKQLPTAFRQSLTTPVKERGFGLPAAELNQPAAPDALTHGAVVIAAITSCTNTSNPALLIGAGLLAQKAVAAGLTVKPHVKTSLTPGSQVVREYLDKTGGLTALEQLGFNLVGYGCATCIGNSGPLAEPVAQAITEHKLIAAAVISGNRNFEGRVHPLVKANYLASPPLVVAYALAGTVTIDFATQPLGTNPAGQPVYLKDLWPSAQEITAASAQALDAEMFSRVYANVFEGSALWQGIAVSGGELYAWDARSTYIQEPPFFVDLQPQLAPVTDIHGARVLVLLGDSVTTDHISPAGHIAQDSPAGQYLISRGVAPKDFNQYGTRRGNDQVLTRGTFANIRLKNLLLGGVEGGQTLYFGAEATPQRMSIYAAAAQYQTAEVPLVVIAGKEYGTGSSRDWAAKGVKLLGVKAVIAESFERIHRSNLVGMGVLPLVFQPGQNAEALGLTGHEVYDVLGLTADIQPRQALIVKATKADGSVITFTVTARLDTPVDVDYYKNGGILPTVLRGLLK